MASLRQLEYFAEVAEVGSLRQAAQRLGVTQPTLTVQLRALEEALGVVLFERTRNATLLTPAGRDLLPEALTLMAQWRNIVESAHLISDHSHSTYRLGVPPTLGPYLLPSLLPSLHQRFQQLRLHVREEVPDMLLKGLEEGRFDLVIGPISSVPEALVREPLFREPLFLASPVDMDFPAVGDVAERDLRGLDILAMDERHTMRREVERICERAGARLNSDYEGTSLDTLRQMVVMGMGLAFLPALYVRSEIHRPEELRVQRLQGGRLFREHAFLYRRHAPSRHFYQQLKAHIREIITRDLGDTVTPLD
ncbi:MAG: hydrogen peroxide-inducible genes activator [Luminiphilus sp.]|nr:hydrogen peroxide-inducible genes activator [Luminiphilus sp.]